MFNADFINHAKLADAGAAHIDDLTYPAWRVLKETFKDKDVPFEYHDQQNRDVVKNFNKAISNPNQGGGGDDSQFTSQIYFYPYKDTDCNGFCGHEIFAKNIL
ncbi:MAG: hypothetical protein GY782_10670 [Gammaproteobacteria bacterium]|nr:hypothetical protein [Gammaproteobacteria bacterium]